MELDMETGSSNAQGNASLEDAEFTWKYYDGYYKKDKIAGDSFYTQDGKKILPLGTIAVEKTKAPDGT